MKNKYPQYFNDNTILNGEYFSFGKGGSVFTKEQIEQMARDNSLSIKEYIKTYNIIDVTNSILKNKVIESKTPFYYKDPRGGDNSYISVIGAKRMAKKLNMSLEEYVKELGLVPVYE